MNRRFTLVSVVLLAPWAGSGSPLFQVVDLGTLGGESAGFAISRTGLVAGSSRTLAGEERAVSGSPGDLRDLGHLPNGHSSRGAGINAAGVVVGTSWTPGGARATVWSGDRLFQIGSLGGADSYGMAINDAGDVAGLATTSTGEGRAFVYSGGLVRDLGVLPGGAWSAAYGLSENGLVAGYGAVGNAFRGFRWSDETGLQALGTLGGRNSYGFAINSQGAVAGAAQLRSGAVHAAVFLGTTIVDLGTLGGHSSYAYGINTQGDVVGYSWTADGRTRAFLYQQGVLYDLNALLHSAGGWELIEAYGIADSGQITGVGLLQGQRRAFRLDPAPRGELLPEDVPAGVPEPAAWSLIAAGLAVLAVAARRPASWDRGAARQRTKRSPN